MWIHLIEAILSWMGILVFPLVSMAAIAGAITLLDYVVRFFQVRAEARIEAKLPLLFRTHPYRHIALHVQGKVAVVAQIPPSKQTIPTGGIPMQDLHRRAAEQHELAAKSHRTAAEHNEKGDNDGGRWHAERALEYSDHAYKLAKEAHNKSGQMVTI